MFVRSRKFSFALILVVLIVTLAVYPGLPHQLVIQINDTGSPSNSAPKWIGVWIVPIVMLILHLTRIDALRGVPGANRRDGSLISAAVQFILALAQIAGLLYNYGHPLLLKGLLPLVSGGLLILIGNLLFRTRPNVTFGIRSRWTLSDPRVWTATHRFAGLSFIAAGLLLILLAAVSPAVHRTLEILLVLGAVNYLASFFFYRKFTSPAKPGRKT
ncbi:SdpI family protein [Saccharibacillus qingshengii]|uniref:SdpI family protein n=1 Tax=Saccharibacillus qingshengii TaxID=1763540 RepID=UPI0015553F46|nr:SdpI family protein [Saccharibacillus qingshengii]